MGASAGPELWGRAVALYTLQGLSFLHPESGGPVGLSSEAPF